MAGITVKFGIADIGVRSSPVIMATNILLAIALISFLLALADHPTWPTSRGGGVALGLALITLAWLINH